MLKELLPPKKIIERTLAIGFLQLSGFMDLEELASYETIYEIVNCRELLLYNIVTISVVLCAVHIFHDIMLTDRYSVSTFVQTSSAIVCYSLSAFTILYAKSQGIFFAELPNINSDFDALLALLWCFVSRLWVGALVCETVSVLSSSNGLQDVFIYTKERYIWLHFYMMGVICSNNQYPAFFLSYVSIEAFFLVLSQSKAQGSMVRIGVLGLTFTHFSLYIYTTMRTVVSVFSEQNYLAVLTDPTQLFFLGAISYYTYRRATELFEKFMRTRKSLKMASKGGGRFGGKVYDGVRKM